MRLFQNLIPIVLWTFIVSAHPAPECQQITWVKCSENVPDYFAENAINITPTQLANLPVTLHCGEFVVPMDYSKPMTKSNNVTLAIAMHRPKNPKGVIFFSAGGSDANVPAAWLIGLNETQAFSQLLDFDLMMMDSRGTYGSTPLNISAAGLAEAVASITGDLPTTKEEYEAARVASAKFLQDLSHSSSPPGVLEFISVKEVTQDYELIRKALDYEKIHFLGTSYGSFRAQQYADTFPQHVGHFVLDAVIPHGYSEYQKVQDQIEAINRIMLRADAYCQNDPSSCPFNGTGSLPRAFHELLSLAALGNLTADTCIYSPSCNLTITPLDIQAIATILIGAIPDFPAFIGLVALAQAGNYSNFEVPPIPFSAVVSIPMECGDYPYNERSWEEFNRAVVAANRAGAASGILQTGNYELEIGCLAWPYKAAKYSPIVTDIPMLFVTADFDPAAPTEWTTWAWKYAKNSALVIRHGDDHTSFSLTDQPSTAIEIEFLRTGKLPKARNETLVSVYTPGMTRSPISNPYLVPTGEMAGDVDTLANLTASTFLPK